MHRTSARISEVPRPQRVRGDARGSHASSGALVALALLAAACTAKETVKEVDFGFDGTCVTCHQGLSSGQVHPTFKLRCVDCHGGDDQVQGVADLAAQDPEAFGDRATFERPDVIALIEASHVKPKPGLARFFFANGLDDDGDGLIDEAPTFDDPILRTQVLDFGEIAELGLQGEGVGQFLDTEYNRDLTYTRWLNPGDLRVATMSCGGGSRVAGEVGSGCHQSVVDTMRRSIMVNQAAVINGAYYGNESWRDDFQIERDDQGAALDPRAGAYGYPLDYADIDACIVGPDDPSPGGRDQPRFDAQCLAAAAAAKAADQPPPVGDGDPFVAVGEDGNTGVAGETLAPFEATQGTLPGRADSTTIAHRGVFRNSSRFEGWGGQALREPAAALPELSPMPAELLAGVPDPVDLVLRGFRAYYPLNYPGSTINQNFTFGESIKPNVDIIKTNNPFGRGHSAGCTACHMAYNYDGSRDPQVVKEIGEDGELEFETVADMTTKHREFDPETQDIVNVAGEDVLVGITVNANDRDVDGDGTLDGPLDRDQQRFYSKNHQLTTAITTQTCGLCHAFVTRIDLAYQGMSEDEQRDALARLAPIRFTTPSGTNVIIQDSMVREENGILIVPSGVDVANLARQRDRQLAEQGFIAGAGGCAATVYTEDCNNNGELDRQLLLQRRNEDGEVVDEVMIDEDLDGDNTLDLIDHAPREESVDGRQMRYVYGGANGSTRLMDIHYERGMHCIDCHMIQDTHGDGNIYSTNWEAMEIECEDCHGTRTKATLVTSGPNGGNPLTLARDHDGRPYFEVRDGKVIQRSRVTPGLSWEVPQTADTFDPDSPRFNPEAAEAHSESHLPDAEQPGGVFANPNMPPGHSELQSARMECYTCHMSWVINCMGCHYNVNGRVDNRDAVLPDGSIVDVAGENEVWFNNSNQDALTNFQLLAFMRSPFVLGYNATADEHRLSTFRSSMQVHVSVNGGDGNTLFENLTFTTHQQVDGNSGRTNVATSGAALNQTMPHTVRPLENRGCEQCHALVNQQGAVRNDHIMAETFGIGAGRYPWTGDWVLVAGGAGLELFDYKDENQLILGNRFPGIILDGLDPADRIPANVAAGAFPVGVTTSDAVLIRNFNPLPDAPGQTAPPTLIDVAAVTATDGVGNGLLVLIDVTGRGRTGRPDLPGLDVVDLGAGAALAVTHLAPDISDPFVYVAQGAAGLTTVELDSQGVNITGTVVNNDVVPGLTVTEVILAGDVLYAGTAEGTIEVFSLADPRDPVRVGNSVDLGGSGAVNGLALGGFFLYAATDNGLAILELRDPDNLQLDLQNPRIPAGADSFLAVNVAGAQELSFASGHVYVAAGADVLDIDVTVPAAPGDPVSVVPPGEAVTGAVDVIVSKVPVQDWLLVVEASGNLVGIKLDTTLSTRERCLPDPRAAGCGLDMDWRDPTIMGRDPTFVNGAFDPGDPSGPPFFRMAATVAGGRRLARPALWEKINTQTGRRYRDSFMPGSGTLSLPVMNRMYGVLLCEDPNTADRNGNGLGALGYADQSFFDNGTCVTFESGGQNLLPAGARAAGPTGDVASSLATDGATDVDDVDGAVCLPAEELAFGLR